MLEIELVYITPETQTVLTINIEQGSTIQQAIEYSGLLKQHPALDLSKNKVGIYGKLKKLNTILKNNDRIEIYRPLSVDPKQARRRRAKRDSNKV